MALGARDVEADHLGLAPGHSVAILRMDLLIKVWDKV